MLTSKNLWQAEQNRTFSTGARDQRISLKSLSPLITCIITFPCLPELRKRLSACTVISTCSAHLSGRFSGRLHNFFSLNQNFNQTPCALQHVNSFGLALAIHLLPVYLKYARVKKKSAFRLTQILPRLALVLRNSLLTLGRTRGVFLSFFLKDKTTAPDVFSSCSFNPCTLFETSSVMVSSYGYEI